MADVGEVMLDLVDGLLGHRPLHLRRQRVESTEVTLVELGRRVPVLLRIGRAGLLVSREDLPRSQRVSGGLW